MNNDYPSEVYYKGMLYPSVSHAFQAARTELPHIRKKISMADSLEELYELASKIENPADWESNRLKAMEAIVRDKFIRHRMLKDKLKST